LRTRLPAYVVAAIAHVTAPLDTSSAPPAGVADWP
jgi:hypothetical protein